MGTSPLITCLEKYTASFLKHKCIQCVTDTICTFTRPTVNVYKKSSVLVAKSSVGDHIVVQNPSGHWRHAIYLGLMKKGSVESVWIIDVWNNKLSARDFDDFVRGGVAFATIDYGSNVLKKQDSADLAVNMTIDAKVKGLAFHDHGEHFATTCRTSRWEMTSLVQEVLPELPPPVSAVSAHKPKFFLDEHLLRLLDLVHRFPGDNHWNIQRSGSPPRHDSSRRFKGKSSKLGFS